MNIVIVGQGAMGLLWHHHFQQLNEPELTITVLNSKSFLSKKAETKQTPSETQYSFTNIHGYSQQYSYVIATENHIRNADVLLLCVKSYQVQSALFQISDLLPKNVQIILAHNGMGTLLDIDKTLQEKHNFLALLTTHGCARPSLNHIIHTGHGVSDIGLLSGQLTSTQTQQLTSTFNQALPTTSWQQNIVEKQWQKLAINCVINPLTALNNVNNGEINNGEFESLKTQIIAEIVLIAAAEKQLLSAEILLTTVNAVALATAKNCSSMRADVLANRPTEIDYINGYIHKLGMKHKIATPENTRLWKQVKELIEK